jgi:hypothetical protein
MKKSNKNADLLLWAAGYWQMNEGRPCEDTSEQTILAEDYTYDIWPTEHAHRQEQYSIAASIALSDVCHGWGYEIEDAS